MDGSALQGGVGNVSQPGMASADGDMWTSARAMGLVLAVAALAINSLRVWIQAGDVFPVLRVMFPPVVDVQTIASALVYGLAAWLSWKAPRLVKPRAFTIAAALGVVIGGVVWIAGITRQSVVVTVVGVCLVDSVGVWAVLLAGILLCTLGAKHDLVIAAVLGEVIGAAFRIIVPDLSLPVAVIMIVLLTLALMVVSAKAAIMMLDHSLSERSISSLATTNPESFLTPSHRLVVLVAFFEFMHGVVLAEGTSIFTLPTTLTSWLLIAVGGFWVLARRRGSSEDTLLWMAAILMVLGFSVRQISPVETTLSEAVSIAGASFSWMLIWASMGAIGMGNPAAALWTFGMCYAIEALAMGAGSLVVTIATVLPIAEEHIFNVMNALVIAAFLAYMIIGMRGFSFSEVFRSVRPVPEIEEVSDRREAVIEENCPIVAARYGLTGREAQVLGLLARGKGGPEIQQELVITQNTAKTHVRHIYRKLGVHSQQELIALVEGAEGYHATDKATFGKERGDERRIDER